MFQEFNTLQLETFPEALEQLLDRQREDIQKIVQSDETSYEKVLKPLQDLDDELSLFFTPLSHLNAVSNSEITQKAYESSIPLLSKFSSEMAHNSALFAKLEQINATEEEAKTVVVHEVRDFILSGAKLPKEDKKRLEEISLRLSELSNRFSQNLLDATNAYELIIKEEKDVEGIPQSDLANARLTKEGKDVHRFTLQIPSYLAYMTYGPNQSYREELYRAYTTRAPENAEVIDEILKLKKEKASILGFSSYAKYALETRDAKHEHEVIEFLEKLAEFSLTQGKEELAELRTFAKELDGTDDLQSYDVGYYSEKLKKRKFDFDDTMTKPYFMQEKVLEGMLEIVSELFSVRFERIDAAVWNEKVKVFDIYDITENSSPREQLSGRIYFDLEAREEKRGGAWMNDWETHFKDAAGKQHSASAFVVCNFSPSSDSVPSLLRHDDVVTLFHEMGHAIHHLFGKCKERSVSGINGVAWDVVEFPSQFLENFAYESAILERFGFHYETGDPIPELLLEKIKETKNFQAATGMLRQLEFALFDFKLHQKLYQGEEIQQLLDRVREKASLMTPPSYNKFQHGFAHIFGGGYAAGYYSYKWAEVLSADAFFACLDEKTGFDKEMAKGYKDHILSRGGSEEMSRLYHEWLGRKADLKSLIRLYEIEE
ncbi:MAG: M3 family metallopeptidase [Campylobacterota bacterium]|nr:M3 family metallopeptidase [Campylobacterota bacterium]